MLELHVFGPAFGQPDPSPFCMKGIILMEMSGLPYTRVRGNLQKAPKGKFPVLRGGPRNLQSFNFGGGPSDIDLSIQGPVLDGSLACAPEWKPCPRAIR